MSAELRLGAPTSARHAPGIACRRTRSADERGEHLAIRHRIFVTEQAVFTGSDVDAHDTGDATIAVLGYSDGIPVGTVRLFPLDPAADRWQGDRLAVLSSYRTLGVGAPLVRYAVATAALLGGHTMSAHIQPANVTFFRRLGWTTTGELEVYAGLPHQPMEIALPGMEEGRESVRRLEAGISARGR